MTNQKITFSRWDKNWENAIFSPELGAEFSIAAEDLAKKANAPQESFSAKRAYEQAINAYEEGAGKLPLRRMANQAVSNMSPPI